MEQNNLIIWFVTFGYIALTIWAVHKYMKQNRDYKL